MVGSPGSLAASRFEVRTLILAGGAGGLASIGPVSACRATAAGPLEPRAGRLLKVSLKESATTVLVAHVAGARHSSKPRLIASTASLMSDKLAPPVGKPARARLANSSRPL